MDKFSDISFMVGITGHRDITMEHEAAVSKQIDTFLTELQAALGRFPVTIACGMADGGDRLVAHRALKLGISVQAILPMPKQYYLSDFSTDSAAGELASYFSGPVPPPPLGGAQLVSATLVLGWETDLRGMDHGGFEDSAVGDPPPPPQPTLTKDPVRYPSAEGIPDPRIIESFRNPKVRNSTSRMA